MTDLTTVIHPIGMMLTLWDWGLFLKFYSSRSSVFCTNRFSSHGVWLFTMHGWSCVERLCIRICNPWRSDSSLSRPALSPILDMSDLGTDQPTPLDPK